MSTRTALEVVAELPDPEMPWVTLGDLGIVRDVAAGPGGAVRVELTPTYLGCPAIDAMRTDVAEALAAEGYRVESVDLRLDPPWTPAAITERGRERLAQAGIAPPGHPHSKTLENEQSGNHRDTRENSDTSAMTAHSTVPLTLGVRCPRCGSVQTALLSRFGASPCQELRRCGDCGEPFPAVRS